MFLMSESTKALDERIASAGWTRIQLERAEGSRAEAVETTERALAFGAEWVVADGYRFGAEWQEVVVAGGLKLLLLDDFWSCEPLLCSGGLESEFSHPGTPIQESCAVDKALDRASLRVISATISSLAHMAADSFANRKKGACHIWRE